MGMKFAEFLERLVDSGLIPARAIVDRYGRIPQEIATEETETVTSALVQEHLLTQYQAAAIVQGNCESLVLGNYIILDRIGQGGMGQVYKAWHRKMKRIVALKTLLPELSQSTRAIQRFHQEVATAAQLTHRNIVTAFDADEVNGTHFLVMEYVDGSDLAAIVRTHGPFPWNDAIRCILDAARGLQCAHQQGIIHRDIKPRNLLLDSKGTVKLLDLGLAQPGDLSNFPKAELTSVGVLVGSTDYAAPEQAINIKQADHRSDIYSLGVSLYFLCTGFIPYPGETVLAKLVAHRESPIPPLSQYRQGAPKELEQICAKMLAKDPHDRYASVRELIDSLEACLRDVFGDSLDGSPIRPPSTSVTIDRDFAMAETKTLRPNTVDRPSRSPVRLVLGAGVVISLLAFLFLFDFGGYDFNAEVSAEPESGEPERAHEPPREIFSRVFPQAPEFGTAFVDIADAERRQQAWTDYLQLSPDQTNSVGMRLNVIPPGVCQIGSSDSEFAKLIEEANRKGLPEWYLDLLMSEIPNCEVEIVFPFLLGVHEVTRAQYEAVIGFTDRRGGSAASPVATDAGDSLPVGGVSWLDAIRFCNALSEREGLSPCYQFTKKGLSRTDGDGYRLPSEAEWEYACRAGTSTRWHFGDDALELSRYAVFKRPAAAGPEVVGSRQANPWGLHDMYGNVWEWCEDAFLPDVYKKMAAEVFLAEPADIVTPPTLGRVVRGGSYSWNAHFCRSANRTYYVTEYRGPSHGFRIARQIRSVQPRMID